MIDLSNEKAKQTAIANFRSLLTHPGWVMLEEIVKANIEVVKQRLLTGSDTETLDEVKRLRDKLAVHEEIINTPRTMIELLTPKDIVDVPDDDPFFKKIEDKAK